MAPATKPHHTLLVSSKSYQALRALLDPTGSHWFPPDFTRAPGPLQDSLDPSRFYWNTPLPSRSQPNPPSLTVSFWAPFSPTRLHQTPASPTGSPKAPSGPSKPLLDPLAPVPSSSCPRDPDPSRPPSSSGQTSTRPYAGSF